MSIDLESLVSSLPEGGDLPARRSASGLPSGIGYYGGGGSAKVGGRVRGLFSELTGKMMSNVQKILVGVNTSYRTSVCFGVIVITTQNSFVQGTVDPPGEE